MAAVGFGLRPYRSLAGPTPSFQVNGAFQIAYNNAHTIGEGDLVIPLSTGFLDIASNQPSNPTLGVFGGCTYPNPANTIQPQGQRAWTAPTLASNVTVTAQYFDDPNIVFAVMATSTSSLNQSAIGLNANFVSNGSPNAATGISVLMLDSTSVSTASNLPLRIVEFQPLLNNGTTAQGVTNPILGVTLNTALANAVTGV